MNDGLPIDLDPAYIEYLFATERYAWLALSYDLAAVLDIEGCFEEVNTGWERTTGYAMEYITGKYLLEFIHFADRERTLGQLQSMVTSADIGSRQISFRFRCRGGVLKDLNWSVLYSPEHNSFFCVVKDVTFRSAEDALALAYQDALTGLSNRLFLDDQFPRILEHAAQTGNRSCSWIWTGSRPSTTPWATRPGTCCCRRWPSACTMWPTARTSPWCASAGMSSWPWPRWAATWPPPRPDRWSVP